MLGALFGFSFGFVDHLIGGDVDLEVGFVEEVGLGFELDDIVQVYGDVGDLLALTLEEVGVDAA